LIFFFVLSLCNLFGYIIHLRWPLLVSTLQSRLEVFICNFVSDSHTVLCINIPFLYFQFHYYVYCTFGTELRLTIIHTPNTDRTYYFSMEINCTATRNKKDITRYVWRMETNVWSVSHAYSSTIEKLSKTKVGVRNVCSSHM